MTAPATGDALRWLPPTEAAAQLGITPDELVRLVTDARLTAHRLPTGTLVFSLADLDALRTPVPADEAARLLSHQLSKEPLVFNIAPVGATHVDDRDPPSRLYAAPGWDHAVAVSAPTIIPTYLGHLLTMDEICAFAQIHPATLYRYLAKGLRSFQYKPGHARRYLLADVLRFMSQAPLPAESTITTSACDIADDNDVPPDLADHIRDVAG